MTSRRAPDPSGRPPDPDDGRSLLDTSRGRPNGAHGRPIGGCDRPNGRRGHPDAGRGTPNGKHTLPDSGPSDGGRSHPDGKRGLVLGGTGMLAGASTALVAAGWHIVSPSRRYAPLAVDGTGRARWIRADWSRPNDLVCQTARVLGGQADLLIAWVADAFREPVLRAVGPLLKPDAPIVEIHPTDLVDPVLPDHPTHQVVLGEVGFAGRTRRLSDDEITAGVLEAVDRALAGLPPITRRLAERV